TQCDLGNSARLDEQFYPVGSFFEFLKAYPELRDHLGGAASAISLTIVSSNRCSRAHKLFAEYLSLSRSRKRTIEPNDSQRIYFRPLPQRLSMGCQITVL